MSSTIFESNIYRVGVYAVRQTRVTRDVAKLKLKLAPEESIEPCVGNRPGPRTYHLPVMCLSLVLALQVRGQFDA